MGQVYKVQGRSEKVIDSFRCAIAVESDFPGAHVNLTRVCQTEENYQEEADIWRTTQTGLGRQTQDIAHTLGGAYSTLQSALQHLIDWVVHPTWYPINIYRLHLFRSKRAVVRERN